MNNLILKIIAITIFSAIHLSLSAQSDEDMIKKMLKTYNTAIQDLNLDNTSSLFSEDSQVFESGGVEGNYEHYLKHHLTPELNEFESFKFSDYKIKVQVDLPYAFTTETYNYTIVVKEGNKVSNSKGVATSILRKQDNEWKIIKTHTSAR
ncbi:MAG: nuclear transport factor 2 family protein, partial [Bacteroidetes bacterium]|nr:nuclear transport factor 2 family protein [Bacteroidota bacterium]